MSKGPATSQSTEQSQANRNRIIDQSRDTNACMQLNWASFGSGVSSVCIIITLSVLLFFCWWQNRKANRKQHQARLHEIAVIAGRESGRRLHGHHLRQHSVLPAVHCAAQLHTVPGDTFLRFAPSPFVLQTPGSRSRHPSPSPTAPTAPTASAAPAVWKPWTQWSSPLCLSPSGLVPDS